LLEKLVEQAPVDDLEMVDKDELLRCLHKAALGVGECAPGWDRLNLTLCALKWLTTQRETRGRSALAVRPFEAPADTSVGPTRSALLVGMLTS
jgi:hypothetical protein